MCIVLYVHIIYKDVHVTDFYTKNGYMQMAEHKVAPAVWMEIKGRIPRIFSLCTYSYTGMCVLRGRKPTLAGENSLYIFILGRINQSINQQSYHCFLMPKQARTVIYQKIKDNVQRERPDARQHRIVS